MANWNTRGRGMDHNWAGGNRMEQGYGPRDMHFNPGYYNDGDFPPHWNEHHQGGPYQQRFMPPYESYDNRRGAGNFSYGSRGRGYSGGGSIQQSQRGSPRSTSVEANKKTDSANDVPQSGKSADDIHKKPGRESVNQKQGPDDGTDQTQTFRDGNEETADENGAQDQSQQNEQGDLQQEQLGDTGAWKPLEGTSDVTVIKQEPDDMEIDNSQQSSTQAVEVEEEEEEDEKAKAIKKLPVNHARGLMSTLIGLIGPEAQNKKPDPLPPPRPMKLEDDMEKYLGPTKNSTSNVTSSISESMFLESGITASMLAEANLEIDYDDRSLMPEDIGRETSRPEFYCKLCQKQMTSLGNFRDHLNGKGHKSMLEAAKMGTKKVPKGKKKAVKALSELGRKSVCLDVVEGATEPVLGLSFITEYHSVTGVVCVCNLCAVKFDQNIVVSHTTGCKHRLRYMREKKPAVYVHLKKFGGKKSQLTTFLSDLCVGVEKEDGRGVPSIKVYHPESVEEDNDSLNDDEYVNRKLINEAKKRANVDEKDLESVDFQDWVNREMRRCKEQVDSQKRSPSPTFGDSSRYSAGRRRSPSVMSDVTIIDYSHGDNLSRRGSRPPPHFPHSGQGNTYMPPPPQPPSFTFGRDQNRRFDAYRGMEAPEILKSPVYYKPDSQNYHDTDRDLGTYRQESRSHLGSSKDTSKRNSSLLFEYGHRSKDREREGVRTPRLSVRSGDDESPPRPSPRGRADERDVLPSRQLSRGRDEPDTIPSRPPARGREDARDIITSRQSARDREDRDVSSRQSARDREDDRDFSSRQSARDRENDRDFSSRQSARGREDDRDFSSRQSARGRADERDIISRQPTRSREDETDEISTSRKIPKNRAETFDVRADITRRHPTRSPLEEWDDIGTSRQKARSVTDKREAGNSVSRADKWEDDIQQILGHGGKKNPLDGLALLSSTYSSPERSPSPPRKMKQAKALPFSKSYLEILESQKQRRSSSELNTDLLDSRRTSIRAEKFVEASPATRNPDVRVRRRSPENYTEDRLSSQHLTRRYPAQRVETPEVVYLQLERSRSPTRPSPVHVRQQKRSRSPSPVRTHKKQVATSSQSTTDAEAERIANLLLELSSSLSGQEDPQTALQTLFSNPDLTRALLSSKNSTVGKPSREKPASEKMHSARSAELGEPSGRHYMTVEQPSRYVESPGESRRYASNYKGPDTVVYQEKLNPKGHSFAMSQGARAMQATRLSRERVAFSLSAVKREEAIRKSSLMNFDDDSDES